MVEGAYFVFHAYCAAFTFTLADSAVKGGNGGLASVDMFALMLVE